MWVWVRILGKITVCWCGGTYTRNVESVVPERDCRVVSCHQHREIERCVSPVDPPGVTSGVATRGPSVPRKGRYA